MTPSPASLDLGEFSLTPQLLPRPPAAPPSPVYTVLLAIALFLLSPVATWPPSPLVWIMDVLLVVLALLVLTLLALILTHLPHRVPSTQAHHLDDSVSLSSEVFQGEACWPTT